jgi:hypothetical protein
MVSFSALRTAARRHAMPLFTAQQRQQRRGLALGGHHGPPPEWTGVDKVVRGYFPEDYQRTYIPCCKIPNSVMTTANFHFRSQRLVFLVSRRFVDKQLRLPFFPSTEVL